MNAVELPPLEQLTKSWLKRQLTVQLFELYAQLKADDAARPLTAPIDRRLQRVRQELERRQAV